MINQNDVPRADWTDYVRLSFALAALAVFVLLCIRYDLLTRTVFWLFVPIPGVIGVIYHVLNLTPRFSNRVATVTKYTEFLEQFDLEWSKKERSFNPMGEELRGDTLSRYTPSVSATLWGAGLLTLAYAIPAELAVKAGKIGLPLAIGPEEVQALTFAALGSYVFTLQRLISRTNSGVLTAKFLMASGLRSIIAILVGYAVGAAGIVSALPAEQ